MTDLMTLLDTEPVVATAGVDLLAEALEAQGVHGVVWGAGGITTEGGAGPWVGAKRRRGGRVGRCPGHGPERE